MTLQLILIDDTEHDWRLDELTRQRGKQGIARARQVLRDASRRAAERDDLDADHRTSHAA